MKPGFCKICLSWLVLFILCLAFGLVPVGMAAESGDGWRATYDLVMRWVNFLILVGIIVKFGRRPLMSFLNGSKEEIAYELRRLEEAKAAVLQEVGKMRQQIEQSEIRYEEMKERIIRQGRSRKQAIIDDARRESQMLMDGSRDHIENRLRSAKRKLRAEIIDLAVDKAMQKLPAMVTEQDHRKLLERFLEHTSS